MLNNNRQAQTDPLVFAYPSENIPRFRIYKNVINAMRITFLILTDPILSCNDRGPCGEDIVIVVFSFQPDEAESVCMNDLFCWNGDAQKEPGF